MKDNNLIFFWTSLCCALLVIVRCGGNTVEVEDGVMGIESSSSSFDISLSSSDFISSSLVSTISSSSMENTISSSDPDALSSSSEFMQESSSSSILSSSEPEQSQSSSSSLSSITISSSSSIGSVSSSSEGGSSSSSSEPQGISSISSMDESSSSSDPDNTISSSSSPGASSSSLPSQAQSSIQPTESSSSMGGDPIGTFIDPYPANMGTSFDGVTQRMEIPVLSVYDAVQDQGFTVEVMIKADPIQSRYPQIISTRDVNGYLNGTLMGLYENGLPFMYIGSSTGGNICYRPPGDTIDGEWNPPSQSWDLRDDQWHHLAFTTVGEYLQIFIDKKLTCSIQTGIRFDFSKKFVIGADLANQAVTYFKGRIKELRLWRMGMENPDDFVGRQLTGNEGLLIGYWPLDPGTYPLNDLSIFNNDAFWAN